MVLLFGVLSQGLMDAFHKFPFSTRLETGGSIIATTRVCRRNVRAVPNARVAVEFRGVILSTDLTGLTIKPFLPICLLGGRGVEAGAAVLQLGGGGRAF